MVFNIEVNNRTISAVKGETILMALRRNGIQVPTLCNMKDFRPTGACRMCVVEIEGEGRLIPSCSHPVEEWMKIKTHSSRVLGARKTIVELLLSIHPDDCLYCERNGNCELQHLAEDLNIRERRIPGKKTSHKIDKSSASIMRDPAKCILCGRCVRVCEETQAVATLDFVNKGCNLSIATAYNKPLNFSSCINCGQCVMFCPTGALTEKINFGEIEEVLHNPAKILIAQYSPTIGLSLPEEFGIKNSKDVISIINSALKKIGFSKVFETSAGSDLYVAEMAEEFIQRLNRDENMPLITGCCPAWVKFAEQNMPEFLDNITTVKSPQQITGSLVKTWYAEKEKISPDDIYSVSIEPCTARKYEAQRVEMTRKGVPDIDLVITTRELSRLIRLHGLNIDQLAHEMPDGPFISAGSTGKLHGISGGLTEAFLRTVTFMLTGLEPAKDDLARLRTQRAVREGTLKVGNREISYAAVSGMANAVKLLKEVRSGRKKYHFIEVMACKGGCIAGGGQMIGRDEMINKQRIKSIYESDAREIMNSSYKNPLVAALYGEFLEKPLSKKSKQYLHISFSSRDT